MKKTKRISIFWILSFLIIAFIWGNSCINGTGSQNISMPLAKWCIAFLQSLGFSIDVTTLHTIVRKLAHFLEYAFLGSFVFAAISDRPLISSKKINFLLFWFGVPSIDETIQYFVPGRNAALKDVLLDACGFLFGAIVCLGIMKRYKKKEHHL